MTVPRIEAALSALPRDATDEERARAVVAAMEDVRLREGMARAMHATADAIETTVGGLYSLHTTSTHGRAAWAACDRMRAALQKVTP